MTPPPPLCATLAMEPAHPVWYRPISLLLPRTLTSEGCSDACYDGLGGYYVHWNATWRVTRPEMVAVGFNTKPLSKGEYEPRPCYDGLQLK
jgi:hypothetical protein